MKRACLVATIAALGLGCDAARPGVLLTLKTEGDRADYIYLIARYDDGRTVPRKLPEGESTAALTFPVTLIAEGPAGARASFAAYGNSAGRPVLYGESQPVVMPGAGLTALEIVLREPGAVVANPDMGPTTDAAPPRSAYATAVLADRPLAYYRLEETSGPVAVDYSGFGIHAVYGNNVARGVGGLLTGEPSRAAGFIGGGWAENKLLVASSPVFAGVSSLTLEAWVKPTPSNVHAHIVAFGVPILFVTFGIDEGRYEAYIDGGNEWILSATPATDNVTHHLALTMDGSTLRLFVDGVLEAQQPLTTRISGNAARLSVGGDTAGSNAPVIFTGVADEVALYDHPLTASQLVKHVQVGRGIAPN